MKDRGSEGRKGEGEREQEGRGEKEGERRRGREGERKEEGPGKEGGPGPVSRGQHKSRSLAPCFLGSAPLQKGTQVGCGAGSSWSNCCLGPNPGSCFPAQLSHHLSGYPNPPLGTKGPQRSRESLSVSILQTRNGGRTQTMAARHCSRYHISLEQLVSLSGGPCSPQEHLPAKDPFRPNPCLPTSGHLFLLWPQPLPGRNHA